MRFQKNARALATPTQSGRQPWAVASLISRHTIMEAERNGKTYGDKKGALANKTRCTRDLTTGVLVSGATGTD